MHSHSKAISGSAILLALLFGTSVTAQLLGCDAVGCPIDDNRFVHCEVGNSTLKAIGIANVTTPLDSRPLTWTLGLQEIQGDGSNLTLDRNFYLGTPPSLQLNDTDGCALFFDGISANLSSTAGDDKFTCSNALAESCVSALITQAQSTYEGFGAETDGSSGLCSRLRDSLVNKPPTECSNLMGTWGSILAQPLTGTSAPAQIKQDQCHPTTGQDYSLSLVASIRKEATSRELSMLRPIIGAITPVMTVLTRANHTDVQLSCLKLVEPKANQTTDDQPSQGSISLPRSSVGFFATIAAVAYFFVL